MSRYELKVSSLCHIPSCMHKLLTFPFASILDMPKCLMVSVGERQKHLINLFSQANL
jgi:hypothetical protein